MPIMHNLCLAAALALPMLVFGQAQVSSGDLKGAVIDPAGQTILKAKVTVSNPDRGLTREVETDDAGEYRVPLLPPGLYRIRFEASGFATTVVEGVEVRVGDVVVLRTKLEVGSVSTELVVSTEAPVVEYERSQQAATIDWRRIENLPINRRQYLDMALLTPGVTPTNDLVDGTDYRVAQAPQSGISFGGGSGRGNAFTIDGVESYINSGGVRSTVSQEVVQEFQVNRNSFAAEIGGAIGGAVNIITKGGTNEVHGNLFGFLRQRDLQARNYFDASKSAFTRVQYGATFSAPIVKNKTFVFAGFERLDRHETSFVPILWDRGVFGRLTPSQQQLADYFDTDSLLKPLAAGMRQALITDNYPRTLKLFDANSGNFPFSESDTKVSLRLDHHFTANHAIFARGGYSKDTNQNAQFGALVGYSRGRYINLPDRTAMLADTWVINSRWVTETRFMWDDLNLAVRPTDPFGPDITITGFGVFGRDILLPNQAYERHFQFQEVLNFTSGRHSLKFGADFNPVRDKVNGELFFGGRFQFAEAVPLASLLPMVTRDPNTTNTVIALLNARGKQSLIPNLQAPISSLQAFNLGLPALYQQGFGNPNWIGWFKRYNMFVQDSFKVRPNLVLNLGARYELETPPSNLPVDSNNIAPRIGFAWTPRANGKTVVRGGWGLYYAPHNIQEANTPASLDGKNIAQVLITPLGIPGLKNPATGQALTSFDVYQYLLGKGIIGTRTITPDDIAPLGLKPGLNAPGRVLFGVDATKYVNLYAQQASFEVERAIGDFAVSAGYNFSRAAHIPRTRDHNLYYAGRTPLNQPVFGFSDPTILQLNIFESTANSFYHALTLQMAKRFSRHFTLNAHYTFSKAIDDVLDFNSDFEPNDQLNARAERALASFNQKHRLVASAVLDSPLSGSGGAAGKLFGNFILAPIVTASSGHPFNLLAGFDTLGDHHPTTHRPFDAGRNIGQGPNYYSFDARLARKFPLGADEHRNIEFTAEGFNLLNRTNFKSINNTVGNMPLASLPRPITGVRGIPTTPLAFTSAFDPRQFQFGLKVNF